MFLIKGVVIVLGIIIGLYFKELILVFLYIILSLRVILNYNKYFLNK
jgi:hypothetical protein